jgi:hypothetical protein
VGGFFLKQEGAQGRDQDVCQPCTPCKEGFINKQGCVGLEDSKCVVDDSGNLGPAGIAIVVVSSTALVVGAFLAYRNHKQRQDHYSRLMAIRSTVNATTKGVTPITVVSSQDHHTPQAGFFPSGAYQPPEIPDVPDGDIFDAEDMPPSPVRGPRKVRAVTPSARCDSCGARIKVRGALFCGKCGAKVGKQ